ncbi:MAG: hypothetical protein JXP73_01415 [Deltaproteobacteria bacterium]|jgi:hypothetical protein|nr:hypothetical protein [Deltaproteobacteria bacterium]
MLEGHARVRNPDAEAPSDERQPDWSSSSCLGFADKPPMWSLVPEARPRRGFDITMSQVDGWIPVWGTSAIGALPLDDEDSS